VIEAVFIQNLLRMREHLYCPSLVGCDGDCMRILLDGCACDLVSTPVVPEVDHLATLALEYPSEDSDRCVVAIENRCCSYDSDRHFPTRGRDLGIGCAVPGTAFHGIPKT
jgi:hypothetical protein